jgi:CBS domain-containing protein
MPGVIPPRPNQKAEPPNVVEETVLDFLRQVPPFQFLGEERLRQVVTQAELHYFPQNTAVLQQGGPAATYLYVIKRGGVKKSFLNEQQEEAVVEVAGEGELFGVLSNVEGESSRLDVVTVAETLCYALPHPLIQSLIESEPAFAHYLLQFSLHHYLDWSLNALRHSSPLDPGNRLLFTEHVQQHARRPLVTCPETTSIQEAARLMSAQNIGSVVITGSQGEVVGIITDRDLRERVIAAGREAKAPVREIMSCPVQTIAGSEPLYEAIQVMITRRLHHLVVTEEDQPIGMITSHDLVLRQGHSALVLSREIERQHDLPGLAQLHKRAQQSLLALLPQGLQAGQLTRQMADLNDHLATRTLQLVEAELEPAPLPYCWLVLGSEGRREQTFKTDQDNALIYANPPPEQAETYRTYFLELGRRGVQDLLEIGYPPCPGHFTADNPLWVQSLSGWQDHFREWVGQRDLADIAEALLFFDLRGLYGEMALAGQLQTFVEELLIQNPRFLSRLNRLSTRQPPPLGFLGQLVLEHDGQHKNELDLKRRGLVPLVDLVRFLAIQHQLRETNTLSRLDLLKQGGALPADMAGELAQGFQFLLTLRLRLEGEKIQAGEPVSYYLKPEALSVLDRQLLKETFKIIKQTQTYVRQKTHMRVGRFYG